MYYPQVEENTNTRSMINSWYGYNHNYRINDGEFYDMENMSSDGFPVLIPRQVRKEIAESEHTYRGILLTGEYLAYIDGNTFYYNDWSIDLTPLIIGDLNALPAPTGYVFPTDYTIETSELTLVRFGSYVLIYQTRSASGTAWKPLYVNVEDLKHSAGICSPIFTSAKGIDITYKLCKLDGTDYENLVIQSTEPSSPQTGDYWLCTNPDTYGLNVYADSSWQPVATTYVRIDVPGAKLKDYFEEGDVVNLNSVDDKVKGFNNGSAIQAIENNYIVIIGILDEVITRTTDNDWQLKIFRKTPTLDYVCVDKNRIWGCRYGYTIEDGLINEIYCTKLGDFSNWYAYQGLSTDSYALTVGVPGSFTGCISYGGYPTFFKENTIIRIYGSYPAEYTTVQHDARGVQSGSYKSLAIVGETLYYQSPTGVMAYDGSLPVQISESLGKDYFFEGKGSVCGSKYYLEMYNSKFGKNLMVYDTDTGIWTKETTPGYKQYTGSIDGQLYAISDKYVMMLGRQNYITPYEMPTEHTLRHKGEDIATEEYVTWMCETGEFGYEYADFKWVSKIALRAYVPIQSEIQVEISYDDKPFENVGTIRGREETMTQTLHINPYRCDHYRLKFKGHGDVRIYTLATTLDTGSDEYGYKN